MAFKQEINQNVNLDKLISNIDSALDLSIQRINKYSNIFLSRGKLTDLVSSKDGNYAMKTSCTVSGLSVSETTLTLVLFEPGDGTGSQVNYQLENVPSKYTPGDKTGVAELFIPIGTLYGNKFIELLNHLTSVTINDGILSKYQINNLGLGVNKLELYSSALNSLKKKSYASFRTNFNAFTFKNAEGNPHAIYFDNKIKNTKRMKNDTSSLIQIGGFLPITKNRDYKAISVRPEHKNNVELFYISGVVVEK